MTQSYIKGDGSTEHRIEILIQELSKTNDPVTISATIDTLRALESKTAFAAGKSTGYRNALQATACLS